MAYAEEQDYASIDSSSTGLPHRSPSTRQSRHDANAYKTGHRPDHQTQKHLTRTDMSASGPGTGTGSPDHLRPGSGPNSHHPYSKSSSATPGPVPHTPYTSHELALDTSTSAHHSHYSAPLTPVSGPSYSSNPPNGHGNGSTTPYYGASAPPAGDEHKNSPAPGPGSAAASADGRPASENFTAEGNPIVPVGISGGKMFQCRGYGQCDKVFTRSEHLARHVRYVIFPPRRGQTRRIGDPAIERK